MAGMTEWPQLSRWPKLPKWPLAEGYFGQSFGSGWPTSHSSPESMVQSHYKFNKPAVRGLFESDGI